MTRKKKAEAEKAAPEAEEAREVEEAAASEANEWRERYLRALAELDNFRKRMERDREQARLYANEGLVRNLLPVLDALEMARAAEGGADAIRDGVALALQDAMRILADCGLEKIEALKKAFDPHLHEAVATIPDPDQEPGMVVAEVRCGYRLHDRVIRPSHVHVAVAPPESAPAEEAPSDPIEEEEA